MTYDYILLAYTFDIKQNSDWYLVSKKQIGNLGGWGFLSQYGSVINALKHLKPEFPWKSSKFNFVSKGSNNYQKKQLELYRQIKQVRSVKVEVGATLVFS